MSEGVSLRGLIGWSYHQHEAEGDNAGGSGKIAHKSRIRVWIRERCLQLALPGHLAYHTTKRRGNI